MTAYKDNSKTLRSDIMSSNFESRSKRVYGKQIQLYNEIQRKQDFPISPEFPFRRTSGKLQKKSVGANVQLDVLYEELNAYATRHFKWHKGSVLYPAEHEPKTRETFYFNVLKEFENYRVASVRDPDFWLMTQQLTVPDLPLDMAQAALRDVCEHFYQNDTAVLVSFKRSIREFDLNRALQSDIGSILALIFLLLSLERHSLKPEFADDGISLLVATCFLPAPFASKVTFVRMLFSGGSDDDGDVIGNGPSRKRKFGAMMLIGMLSLASGINTSLGMNQVSATEEIAMSTDVVMLQADLFHANHHLSADNQIELVKRFKETGLDHDPRVFETLSSDPNQFAIYDPNDAKMSNTKTIEDVFRLLYIKSSSSADFLNLSAESKTYKLNGKTMSKDKVLEALNKMFAPGIANSQTSALVPFDQIPSLSSLTDLVNGQAVSFVLAKGLKNSVDYSSQNLKKVLPGVFDSLRPLLSTTTDSEFENSIENNDNLEIFQSSIRLILDHHLSVNPGILLLQLLHNQIHLLVETKEDAKLFAKTVQAAFKDKRVSKNQEVWNLFDKFLNVGHAESSTNIEGFNSEIGQQTGKLCKELLNEFKKEIVANATEEEKDQYEQSVKTYIDQFSQNSATFLRNLSWSAEDQTKVLHSNRYQFLNRLYQERGSSDDVLRKMISVLGPILLQKEGLKALLKKYDNDAFRKANKVLRNDDEDAKNILDKNWENAKWKDLLIPSQLEAIHHKVVKDFNRDYGWTNQQSAVVVTFGATLFAICHEFAYWLLGGGGALTIGSIAAWIYRRQKRVTPIPLNSSGDESIAAVGSKAILASVVPDEKRANKLLYTHGYALRYRAPGESKDVQFFYVQIQRFDKGSNRGQTMQLNPDFEKTIYYSHINPSNGSLYAHLITDDVYQSKVPLELRPSTAFADKPSTHMPQWRKLPNEEVQPKIANDIVLQLKQNRSTMASDDKMFLIKFLESKLNV